MELGISQGLDAVPLGEHALDCSASDGVLALLSDVFRHCEPVDFSVRLWDGRTWGPGKGRPALFTLQIRHPAAVRRLLVNPDFYSLGEAYVMGLYDIKGDLAAAFQMAEHIMDQAPAFAGRVRYALQTWRLLSAPLPEPPAGFRDQDAYGGLPRTRRAVNFHHDQPVAFWQNCLDRELVYSCAYYHSADDSLDAAQEHKLEHVCRKLYLKPGERLLDIGCGWGALAIYAARHYGVHATGITLSEQQAEYARARIRQEGLESRCRIEVADIRQWSEKDYDKISSIEVIEHVPQVFQHQYFMHIRDLLRPGGLFLNHGINCSAVAASRGGSDFIDKYVLPDYQLVPLATLLRTAEGAGWEVRDVESLREHYAMTLDTWRSRLEENEMAEQGNVPEPTCRIFRISLGAAAADFRSGGLNVYQTLLASPDEGALALPLTREAWYGPGANAAASQARTSRAMEA